MGKGSGVVTIGLLVVWGWIIVDIWGHPAGTSAAFSGLTNLSSTVGNQVTGKG